MAKNRKVGVAVSASSVLDQPELRLKIAADAFSRLHFLGTAAYRLARELRHCDGLEADREALIALAKRIEDFAELGQCVCDNSHELKGLGEILRDYEPATDEVSNG